MAFGLVRRSNYKKLKKEKDELKEQVKALTSEVETQRREIAELRKAGRASGRKMSQLEKEADDLRAQSGELSNSVEILTKEREIFQKTIRRLAQAVKRKKRKKKTPP